MRTTKAEGAPPEMMTMARQVDRAEFRARIDRGPDRRRGSGQTTRRILAWMLDEIRYAACSIRSCARDASFLNGDIVQRGSTMDSLNEIKARIEIDSEDFTVNPDETGTYIVRFKQAGDAAMPIGLFVEEGGSYVFRFATPRSADLLIEDDDCKEFVRVIQKAGQLFEAQAEQQA
jgi:hypothetical protein